MKKIYFTLTAGLFLLQNFNAQTTLTKAANDPAIGDLNAVIYYDTTAVLPLNTGANQTWNFSSLTMYPGSLYTTTFVAVASSTAASQFPAATIAEKQDINSYAFYTADANQTEIIGSSYPGGVLQYTNALTVMKWPTAYGNTFTDNFSGFMTSSTGTINLSGSVTSLASGNGNIILPGGAGYSNILQVKTTQNTTFTLSAPVPTTMVIQLTNYSYYNTGTKFPLLTVVYDDTKEATVTVNKNVAVGLTDYNLEATFAIYPNPAKTNFNVRLSNTEGKNCIINIYNATGKLVKNYDLGNGQTIESNVSINGLAPGIYMVNTTLGQKSSSRRLIVE